MLKTVSRPGLTRTLIMCFLIIALAPLAVISAVNYMQARNSLEQSIVKAQQTAIVLKAAFIDNWFSYRFLDLESQSTDIENARFLGELSNALQETGNDVKKFVKSDRWSSIIDERGDGLKAFQRIYGYYDVFLIDLDGNILFTAIGEPDLGTNLFTGPYSNTLFSRACRQSITSGGRIFSDFEFYVPSDNEVAGFLVSSIVDENGDKKGLFAMQIPIDKINAIIQDRTGMGKTGETYLIGADLTLRSDSAVHEEEKILITRVDTEQTRKWHSEHIVENKEKESEVGFIYRGHHGKNILGTHILVNVAGVKWGLIAEIEETEAFAPVTRLKNIALLLGMATGVIVLISAFLLSWRIVTPLLNLTAVAKKVQEGKKNMRADVSSKDEIKTLAETFNIMLDTLNEAITEAELSHDKIDGILKSVADGLIVTDINNNVVLMNNAAEELLETSFSLTENNPIGFAIKNEVVRDKIVETINQKTTGDLFDFELESDDPDHPKIMRARTSVVFDSQSRETCIVTIIHDVTHEREMDRMKTEFISTAAHELRTPLTSIQGFSEILLMRENLKPEDKIKFLTHINKQSIELAKIINDLLDISRIESGKGFTLNKTICNLSDIIKQVIPYFQDQHKKHQFEVIVPDEPVQLTVDNEKIIQVLKNLLSNAVKYSPGGGPIQITCAASKDYYQVSIEDQGIGMTPEQVDKIFDKFYRVDASNTAIEGTGLGMSIVKYIIEAHGGDVRVESKINKGTTVSFMIPKFNKGGGGR